MTAASPTGDAASESMPFNTIHVAHALQRAQIKDFDVPEEMQSSALDYLRDIEELLSRLVRHAAPARRSAPTRSMCAT